jgi:hypothetical protein
LGLTAKYGESEAMKTMRLLLISGLVLALTGCAGTGKKTQGSAAADSGAQLKVVSGAGKLKAKLAITNTSSRDMVLKDLREQYFKVETLDNKPMPFKSAVAQGEKAPAVVVKPGQTIEQEFSLQNNFPFWDRLTKYKIKYDSPELESNEVQVWF